MTQGRVSHLYVGPERRENRKEHFEPKDIFRFLLRNYKLALFFSVMLTTLTFIDHNLFPQFRAKSTIVIDNTDTLFQTVSQRLQGASGNIDLSQYQAAEVDKYIRYLQNYEFYLEVAKQVKEAKLVEKVIEVNTRPRNLIAMINSSKGPTQDPNADNINFYLGDVIQSWTSYIPVGVDGISVYVSTADKEFSRSLADIIAKAALKWISQLEIRQSDYALNYLTDQIHLSEIKITSLERELLEFKQKNKIVSINGSDAMRDKNAGIEEELKNASIQYDHNERMLKKYKSALKEQEAKVHLITSANPNLVSQVPFKSQLSKLIADSESLSISLKEKIFALKRKLDLTFDGNAAGVEQQIYEYRKKFELEYSLYQDLLKEKFKLEMKKVSLQNRVRNLSKAEYSEVSRPISLTKKLLISELIALVLALGFAYAIDTSFPSVKSRNDLMEMGFTFIGGIENFNVGKKTKLNNLFHKINGKIVRVFRYDLDNIVLGGLFKIRTKLLHHLDGLNKDHAVIAFVGACPGDGKTFSASNVAASLASIGRKTLIIDTDLRAGGTSKLFQLHNQPGLVDVLENNENFGKYVVKNVLPHLDVLPCGRNVDNPTDFIARSSMPSLMGKLSHLYDFVILDTPPILLVPEVVEMERAADLLVFVSSFNRTKIDDVVRSCDTLLEFGRGSKKYLAILNRVDSRHDNLVISSPYHYHNYGKNDQSVAKHV